MRRRLMAFLLFFFLGSVLPMQICCAEKVQEKPSCHKSKSSDYQLQKKCCPADSCVQENFSAAKNFEKKDSESFFSA
ncbi:MAG TPA: hypothetical protein PL048_26470, partial [Leptospiraceae bacterium]|nr:hypothetical protein [Leptospiraceae bacterium]